MTVELAFLVMDLLYRCDGDHALANAFLDEYVKESGDTQIHSLLALCCSYRAMVRAKCAAFIAADDNAGKEQRASSGNASREYLALAASFLVQATRPRVVMLLTGLPGVGKSSLAAVLAKCGWHVFASDIERKLLAGASDLCANLDAKFYAPAFSQRVYATLVEKASLAMSAPAGALVLLDANFRTAKSRSQAIAALQEQHKDVFVAIVYLQCSDAVARRRLEQREQTTSISDATVQIFDRVRDEFDAPSNDKDDAPVLVVDADSDDNKMKADVLLCALLELFL